MDKLRRWGASRPWWLRALGRGYLSFGAVMSHVVSFILMFGLYWFLIPFFLFLKIGDPLKVNLDTESDSYWEDWKKKDHTIERFSRMF